MWECRTPDPSSSPDGLWVINLWPGGIVPYVFDAGVTPENQQKALAAMTTIEAVCNARFIPRNGHPNYVVIRSDTSSYSSRIGMAGGQQTVGIFPWDAHYVIVHELIHALGAWHENQRPDRDAYITINFHNILPNQQSNFTTREANIFGWYDFDSVMHYRRFQFTSNGHPTIDMNPGYERWKHRIGQVSRLSTGDIWLLTEMYGGPRPPGVFDLQSPGLDAIVGVGWSPSFSWTPAELADSYRLLVDDDFLFGSPAIDVTLAASSYAGGVLENGKVYYWTVRAQNSNGVTVPWHTPIGAFHTGAGVAPTLYVDDSATPGGDGSSWATAFQDLQHALAMAACAGGSPVEIRVGQGTYKPDRGGGDREASFVLRSNFTLLGGFAGHGAVNPNARDIVAYPTILSGDLAGDDGPAFQNYQDNSMHVIWMAGQRAGRVTIDGFVVTAGNADGQFFPTGQGGGLWADDCDLLARDCTFVACRATVEGGGAFIQASDASLERCAFIGNLAVSEVFARGGGFQLYNGWRDVTIDACSLVDNEAYRGGGAHLQFSNATLRNTIVEGNTGTRSGGGIMVADAIAEFHGCTVVGNAATAPVAGGLGGGLLAGSVFNMPSEMRLINCLVTGNTAANGGGGVEAEFGARVSMVNCTVTANNAPTAGGVYLFSNQANPSTTSAELVNTVVHGNASAQIVEAGPRVVTTVTYSNIQGGWHGTGNIDEDPLFVGSGPHPYLIAPDSPCVDAGDNTAVPAVVLTDLIGNPRFIDEPSRPDTGVGPPPIVDMGAYEVQSCYADCDPSTGPGILDIFDFLCFGNLFAANDPYACDCDTTTGQGVCDIFDFLCFGNEFDKGCS